MNDSQRGSAGVTVPKCVALISLVIIAVGIRLILAGPRHNFDFNSWVIVADIMNRGGNVYAETTRYNYGPIWSWLLHAIDSISRRWFGDSGARLRLGVAALLSLVDLGLFAVIWRRYDLPRAIAALLSPIAILISGYHGQFDNLALLLGMLAVLLYESDEQNVPGPSGITKWRFGGYVMLGLSLMAKHILFLFPLWLAIRERTWRARLWAVWLPFAVFLSGFLAYMPQGRTGIITNVFHYRSVANAPLWNAMFASAVGAVVTPMQFFLGALLGAGYLTKRWSTMDALLWYTLVLVCFAPAVSNQSLAIVVPAIAVFTNLPFLLYIAVATLLLVGGSDGLLPQVGPFLPEQINSWLGGAARYQLPIVILFAGTLWAACGTRVRSWFREVRGTRTG